MKFLPSLFRASQKNVCSVDEITSMQDKYEKAVEHEKRQRTTLSEMYKDLRKHQVNLHRSKDQLDKALSNLNGFETKLAAYKKAVADTDSYENNRALAVLERRS